LFCHMPSRETSSGGSEQRMMTGIMAGDSTDQSAFDASFGLDIRCSSSQRSCAEQCHNQFTHGPILSNAPRWVRCAKLKLMKNLLVPISHTCLSRLYVQELGGPRYVLFLVRDLKGV
jgi:hypothetical protein